MQVECALFGPLRESVGEKNVVLQDVTTVGEALDRLEATYPELEGRLVAEGEPVDGLAVTLNTRHVRYLDGMETELSDGDVLRMTPAVYGG